MIELQLDGVNYNNFKSIRVQNSVQQLSGQFKFIPTARDGENFPIKLAQEVSIIVDGEKVITGPVEIINPSYSSDRHSIAITGRDKTSRVVDSTIGSGVELKGPILFKTAIERILSISGITGISVVDNVGSEATLKKGQIVAHKVGTSIFQILDKYAKQLKVILTSDGEGNIVITRTGQDKSADDLRLLSVSDPGAQNNNIVSGSVKYDMTKRFGKYIVHSQTSPTLAFDESLEGVTDQQLTSNKIVVIDKDVDQSRVLNLKSEVSTDSAGCKARAEWESNIRRVRSFSYNCVVSGHSVNGEIWKPNTLVRVIDTFANLDGDFLISAVEYISNPETDGDMTALSIVYQDAFSISPVPPRKNKSTSVGVPEFREERV